MAPTRVDTLTDSAELLVTHHGAFPIYWHADVGRDAECGISNCSVEELARGRATLADAPADQISIARWFGPAQALAELSGGIGRLVGKPVRVTTVSSITGMHPISDLRATTVESALLILPADFKEIAWPGFAGAPRAPVSSDSRKWRSLPR